MFKSLLPSLIVLGTTVVSLPFLVFCIVTIVIDPGAWWGLGWMLGLFIVPSICIGLCVGLVGYASGYWARRSSSEQARFIHALVVGLGSGGFGSVPVGFLVSVSGIGISFPAAALGSGIILMLVFAGYVLLWQQHAKRRNLQPGFI